MLAGSGGVQSREGPAREVALAEQSVQTVSAPREVAVAPATPARPSVGERAMSNIRQVFDTQKSVLYALYQRELRQDPTLEGKVTLELVIEPDGSVSACQVVSSELGNPALGSALPCGYRCSTLVLTMSKPGRFGSRLISSRADRIRPQLSIVIFGRRGFCSEIFSVGAMTFASPVTTWLSF